MKYSATLIEKEYDDPFFDRKIENATEGLLPSCRNALYRLSHENALTIANYILSMKAEINSSNNYTQNNIMALCSLSKFANHQPFNAMTRENILGFLDSCRKAESLDPLHKWIGTYNLYRIYLLRFFKWLYYPDIGPGERPKPQVIENIPKLKRKEQSIYKPTDVYCNRA